MKSRAKPNPESEWVRKEHAFEPIVDMERFCTVQAIYRERNKRTTNEELLQGLRDLYARQGRLSAMIIDEADFLPPSSCFAPASAGCCGLTE